MPICPEGRGTRIVATQRTIERGQAWGARRFQRNRQPKGPEEDKSMNINPVQWWHEEPGSHSSERAEQLIH